MRSLQLPILVFVVLSFTVISCGKVKEPAFKGVENIRAGKVGFNHSTINLDPVYFNPNRSGLKLKEAEGHAWVDGQFVGHFTLDSLVVIHGNSDFRLPVTFNAETGKLVKNSLLGLLGQESLFKIEGKALAGKGGIFVRYPIRYEGKHRLSDLLQGQGEKVLLKNNLPGVNITR